MINKLTKEQVEELVSSGSVEEFNSVLRNNNIQLSDEDLEAINGGFADWLADLARKNGITEERITNSIILGSRGIEERILGANLATANQAVESIASGRPKDVILLNDNSGFKNKH